MKMFKIILIFITMFLVSCTANVLDGLGSQSSDSYYFEEATKANNSLDYDHAIYILTQQVSADGQQSVRGRELLASAYAGKCGLNFVEYTSNLADSTSGTAFEVVMNPFVGIEANPEYCVLSLDTMNLIGTSVQRTANQNAFVAITGLVLMGTALRGNLDTAPVNGDGAMDVDVCDDNVVEDSKIEDVVLGFGYFSENIAYVSADLLGGSSFNALDQVVSTCNSVPGAQCTVTNRDDISQTTKDTMRDLIETSDYGIGDTSIAGNDALIPLVCP